MRFHRRTACLLVAVVAAALAVVSRHFRRGPDQAFLLRHNLRAIGDALAAYNDSFNELPYHAEGDDFALYLLKDSLDASVFNGAHSDPKIEPYWSDHEKRLRNGQWEYINVSNSGERDPRQVLVSSKRRTSKTVYLGSWYGLIHSQEFEEYPGRALLGNWITADGFILTEKETLRSWDEIHPSGRITTVSRNDLLFCTRNTDLQILYNYQYDVKKHLKKCEVLWENHGILDTVETDAWGRVVRLTRSPEDWKTLWAKSFGDGNGDAANEIRTLVR